jgi:hypothetical protein
LCSEHDTHTQVCVCVCVSVCLSVCVCVRACRRAHVLCVLVGSQASSLHDCSTCIWTACSTGVCVCILDLWCKKEACLRACRADSMDFKKILVFIKYLVSAKESQFNTHYSTLPCNTLHYTTHTPHTTLRNTTTLHYSTQQTELLYTTLNIIKSLLYN